MKRKLHKYCTNISARKHWLKAVHFTIVLSAISTDANDCYTCAVSANQTVTSVMR